MGFPDGSDSKESAYNAGDLDSIPGQEDPLEKGMATHSSILAWRILWTRSLAGYSLWVHKESDTAKQLTHSSCIQSNDSFTFLRIISID